MKNSYKNTLDEILGKKFSKNFSVGYDSLEVDMFFDKMRKFIVNQYQKEVESQKTIIEKDKKISKLESEIIQKNHSIAMLQSEIESYLKDGYQSQRLIQAMSDMRRELDDIKKDKKKDE